MGKTQTWIWTALPDESTTIGRERFLRLNVLCSPRLHVPRLTDEWRHWPLTAERGLRFTVRFRPDPGQGLSTADWVWDETDHDVAKRCFREPFYQDQRYGLDEASERWRTLFNRNTLEAVRGRVPVRLPGPVLCDTSVKPMPLQRAVLCDAPDFHDESIDHGQAEADVKEHFSQTGGTAVTRNRLGRLEQLSAERLAPKETVKVGIGRTAEIVREYDFHERMAALADYPSLLRMFRVVVELRLPWRVIAPDNGLTPPRFGGRCAGRVWVEVKGGTADQCSAGVACEIDARGNDVGFRVRAHKDHPFGDEIVNRRGSNFAVSSLDAVSAAIKVCVLEDGNDQEKSIGGPAAANLRTAASPPASDAMPALRTTGFTIRLNDAAAQTQAAVSRQAGLDEKFDNRPAVCDVPPLTTWLDQLIIGYRAEVARRPAGPRPAGISWPKFHSLCRRRGTYRFADAVVPPLDQLDDEGFLSDSHTQRGDSLLTNNAIATWTGYGLCITRPSKEQDLSEDVRRRHNELPNVERLPLDAHFDPVPRSLPPLRLGDWYTLRVRPVDLTGQTVRTDPADAGTASTDGGLVEPADWQRFRRFEPVAAPLVLGPRARAAGDQTTPDPEDLVLAESTRVMVVYSAEPEKGKALSDEMKMLIDHAPVRWLLPPHVSPQMAEWHGMLDKLSAGTAYRLLRDHTHVPEFLTSSTGRRALSYLPDPLAMKLHVELQLESDEIFTIPDWAVPGNDRDHWPDWRPIRLALLKTKTDRPKLSIDASRRTLTVALPKGRRGQLRVRYDLSPEQRDTYMALNDWPNFRIERLTPFVAIDVVHAVDRPSPLSAALSAEERAIGAISQPVRCDFSERFNDLSRDTDSATLSAVFSSVVDDKNAIWNGSEGPQARKTFATINVPLKQSADGTCGMTLDVPTPSLAHCRVVFTGHSTSLYRGLFTVPQTDGRTTSRRVADKLSSEMRFFQTTPSDAKNYEPVEPFSQVIEVLNASPPPPPEVAYVLPLVPPVGTDSEPGDVYGVRVFMRRPWFVSGASEQLGVVLLNNRDEAQRAQLNGLYTQWGVDPLRGTMVGGTSDMKGPPGWDDLALLHEKQIEFLPNEMRQKLATMPVNTPFPRPIPCDIPPPPPILCDTRTNAVANETPGAKTLTLKPLPVYAADPLGGERLCYADVIFRSPRLAKEYFPLVQLALVRYQPHSVKVTDMDVSDPKVSTITLTDFTMLPANRSLTVNFVGTNATITLVAPFGTPRTPMPFPTTVPATNPSPGTSAERGVRASVVRITVERSVITADGVTGWAYESFPASEASATYVAEGQKSVCKLVVTRPRNGTFRLVLREYETYLGRNHNEAYRCVLVHPIPLDGL